MKKLFLALVAFAGLSTLKAQTYTWAENAACIFYTNCTKCHFPGGPGPFSLIDYNSAFTARFAIKAAILADYMPPWPPDENYQTYAHERLITQQEKDVLVGWVDQGGLPGNLANAPTAPSYSATGSQLSQVDFSGGVGNYTNTATLDDYRCFVIPTNFATDQFISDIEIIPGNRAMVHHVLIYTDTDTAAINALDASDAGLGYQNFGGTGNNGSRLIGGWVPGSEPQSFPTGMGVKIDAGSYIILQIHYPQGTNGDVDSNTVINLKYAGGAVREVFFQPALNYALPGNISPYPLHIPSNSVRSFTETYTVPNTAPFPYVTVLGVAPHMHKVGTSIKAYAVKPGNDTVPLIDIPHWDFKWQGQYNFRQPLTFPTGTVLIAEAVYDNTSNNPLAPNPNNDVWAGEATTDEMMLVYFSYLYGLPGDANIVIDTVTTHPTYMACNFMGIEDITGAFAQFKLYPNPASGMVNLSFEQFEQGDVKISVVDITGKIVSEYYQPQVGVGTYLRTLDIENYPNGLYYVRVWNGSQFFAKPVIITH